MDEKLVNLRKQIREENFFFFDQNENPIDIEKENDYPIKEIIDENKIIKIGSINKVKVIFPNKEIKQYNYLPQQKLNEFRKINNIPKEYIFNYEDAEVDLDDEKTCVINDIIKNREIFLNKINEEEKIKKKEEEEKIKKKEEEKNKKEKRSNRIKGASFIKNIGKKELFQYNSKPFDKIEESQCYTILVLGETGSGKTTLLNSFLNYLLNIKINDKERYIIINEENFNDQSISHTLDVNIYYIKSHNGFPPIKIIDTPGFGDNRKTENDKSIIKKIGELFLNKLIKINAICLVVQSFNIRLTLNQKYIFQSVINLFGKNVIKNFIIMLTFSDGGKSQIIDSLLNDSSFSIIKNYLEEPWYLNFNNSAIFTDRNDQITDMYYQLAMESFEKFLIKIKSLPSKSVNISKDVFVMRERINIIIEYLIREIHNQTKIINYYRQLIDKLNNINCYRFYSNCNLKINLLKKEYKDCESFMINCYSCNSNCQKVFKKDILNESLLFDKGYCILCKCNLNKHKIEKKEIEYIFDEATINFYYQRNEKKQEYYNMIKDSFFDSFKKFGEINKLNKQLQNNALLSGKGNYEDYIDMMIIDIEKDKKVGFAEEIHILNQFKETLNYIFMKKNNRDFEYEVKLVLDNFIKKIL